jgi:hypothetical protein
MIQKTKRPADVAASAGPREIDQLAREINPTNSPKPDELQAADDTGESDHDFFVARPHARHRMIRAAFTGEFPRKILKQGRGHQAVVIVAIERDADGRPTRRARSLVFPNGGTA